MFVITKTFHFEAAHSLGHLPREHKCSHLHGHSYAVTVECRSFDLDDDGFVVDFAKLDVVKKFIDEKLDHQDLNDVMRSLFFTTFEKMGIAERQELYRTTSENLAFALFWHFIDAQLGLIAVKVSETEKTSAEFRQQ